MLPEESLGVFTKIFYGDFDNFVSSENGGVWIFDNVFWNLTSDRDIIGKVLICTTIKGKTIIIINISKSVTSDNENAGDNIINWNEGNDAND